MKSSLVLLLAVVSTTMLLRAQTAPRFESIQFLTNREVHLRLQVTSGRNYQIRTATNMANLATWQPLVTLTGVTASLQYTDSAAPYLNTRLYVARQLSGTNILTGDHVATTNGDAIVHPINHASFVLSWNNRMIYNDPTGGATRYGGLPRADLILVSHSHGDHFDSATIDAVRGSNTVIVVPQAVFNSLTAVQRPFAVVLTNGASTEGHGMLIEAVPAYNSNHPRGTGNGYVLTIGGRRFYMAGDTGDTPEMRALTNIDVAFLCMNIPFTMSVPEAASALRAFRPRVVYPYHYRNGGTPVTYADLEDLKRRVGQDLGIEVRVRAWY